MKKYTQILLLLLFYSVLESGLTPHLYGQAGTDWGPSLFSPAAILIHDQAIRSELAVTKEQMQTLDQVCEALDPLLFAMRDVPANTTHAEALATAARITEKLGELDSIINNPQQQRLEQICLQYEGVGTLFDSHMQSRLRLTAEQTEQMRQIHTQSLAQQQKAMQQKALGLNTDAVQRQIREIQRQAANKIINVMTSDQQKRWQAMLGKPFDFSQVRPLSFHAPELQNVTAWINTKPVSMEDLRGRVVVVHFWTFGCINCIHNYPVYKQWIKQYDPKEVFILGIHTPEGEHEKDQTTLQKRIEQEGLSFAVAVDNDKTNWKAWANSWWPSVYLVDKKGKVRYWWYGELKWQGATGDQLMTKRIEELRAEP